MKITDKTQQPEPPRVRYGDLPVGAAFRVTPGGVVVIKRRDRCVSTETWDRHLAEHDDTLVIPLNAELVIHGYAGVGLDPERCERDAELDALRREVEVLREFAKAMHEPVYISPAMRERISEVVLAEADRIRREAEGGGA